MLFTDDNPKMLKDINPANATQGPIFISNHSSYGFNIRHFFMHWQTGEWRATKKGVAVANEDAPALVAEIVNFINEVEILPGKRLELVIHDETQ